jgi:hypothetical protein
VGRHEAYVPTLSEKTNHRIDGWLASKNLARPKLPRVRSRRLNPFFAFLFVTGMVFVTAVDPYAGNVAAAYSMDFSYYGPDDGQVLGQVEEVQVSFARGGFNIIGGKAFADLYVADAGIPDPGTAKEYAYKLSAQLGWGQDQYSCLVKLWTRESNWRVTANNSSSGAYGIPQALPGSKMASEGNDWMVNAETQIRWGLKYIHGRYHNPCTALVHSNNFGWY